MTQVKGFKTAKPTGKPIVIDSKVVESCFNLSGLCGSDVDITHDDVAMVIKKAGACDPLIEYPAFSIDGSKVCFYWDDLLYNLETGRYIGEIWFGDDHVTDVQLQKNSTTNYTVDSVSHTTRKQELDCDAD